jgi:hypothetical protein
MRGGARLLFGPIKNGILDKHRHIVIAPGSLGKGDEM